MKIIKKKISLVSYKGRLGDFNILFFKNSLKSIHNNLIDDNFNFRSYPNFYLQKDFFKTKKNSFSDKSISEDLIEQILQTKTNNSKKSFSAQENSNLNYNVNYNIRSGYKNSNSNYNNRNNNVNDISMQNQNQQHLIIKGEMKTGDIDIYNNNYQNRNYIKNGISQNNNKPIQNTNYNNNNINNNNENNNNINNSIALRKRNRISIIRDGMNITMNLRRVIINIIFFQYLSQE